MLSSRAATGRAPLLRSVTCTERSDNPTLDKYQHEPLADNSSQIRLLKIHSSSPSDHVTISISTFDRRSAPSYATLSYTWGDGKPTKAITANGKLFLVTQNCWYALGQLQLFGFCDYYWVDSVCIAQEDPIEKSAQVNLMGDTYRNADCVLVSLGRHTQQSAFLFSQVTTNGISTQEIQEDVKIDDWLKQLDPTTLERLLAAVTAFGTLPYWNRLWVTQEYALPPQVLVLCGNGCIDGNMLHSLLAMLSKLLSINREWHRGQTSTPYTEAGLHELPMSKTMSLRSTVHNSRTGLASLAEVILLLGTRNCADLRDRIFGLLSLVEWPNAQQQLHADYSMTLSELALKTLQCCESKKSASMACQLLRMLEIPPDDPGMLEFGRSRLLTILGPLGDEAQPDVDSKPIAFSRCANYFRLSSQETLIPVSGTWQSLEFYRIPKVLKQITNTTNPLHIKMSVLIPTIAQPGDIVLQLDSLSGGRGSIFQHHRASMSPIDVQFDKAALVLRFRQDNVYDIIGHAIFGPKCETLSELTKQSGEDGDFDLRMDAGDLLHWAWQLHNFNQDTFVFEQPPEYMTTGFCRESLSSYAVRRPRSEKAVMHDTALAAASLTQNAGDVRQRLALRRIGQ